MRIIKRNTLEFPSLYTTLIADKKGTPSRKTNISERMIQTSTKHEELFESLYTFGRKIRETNSIPVISEYMKTSLKKFIDVSEVVCFNTAKDDSEPIPLSSIKDTTWGFVKTIHEDGMLHKILHRGHLSIIPTRNKNSQIYNYYLVYPIIDLDRTNNHFILFSTTEKHFESGTFMRKVLESFVQLLIPRVEYLLQKKDLGQTYDELQVYQSKISNDYKLSAIGEMTYSLINQIISPMQVVLSCVDIIENKTGPDDKVVNTIKTQVKKVQSITDKIVKFSAGDNARLSVIPCSLNGYVNKFHDFIKSSLTKRNYEIILDLDNSLPPVLSTPNYMHQILTNTFSLMVTTAETGGLYLQTKYFEGNVLLRIISTDHTNIQTEEQQDFSKNINLMMLDTLMKKHEGHVKFTSDQDRGSNLELIFPLKRKLLK